jgi:hypothetical protein
MEAMLMVDDQYFKDLPQALVEELIKKCEDVGGQLIGKFEQMKGLKETIRQRLQGDGLLKTKAALPYQAIPTCCGVDGAYAVEKMLSNDIIAVSAVAIEGLTPPSETRFWEGPTHLAFIDSVGHDVSSLPRGIMMAMEMKIACNAPHDIVMLDGSFTTPVIHMNQALNSIDDKNSNTLSRFVEEKFPDFLNNYLQIVSNKRSDKVWVYLPKYTTKHELKTRYGSLWPFEYDDKAVLTQILAPGELVGPLTIEHPDNNWHFSKTPGISDGQKTEALYNALNEIALYYYRPNLSVPALRIEMSKMAAGNISLVSKILQCLEFQCSAGGMMEPYPLYMSDRMVKSLGMTMPTFRQAVTLQIAQAYQGDLSDVFFSMHGYRTESGRN